ncbi:YigZ family protein [Bacillus thuringiensis]|uniref:YigZ family protein n=1 Tax=Bacillus thuringiensis TaxID=1428 RepID=UPI0010AD6D16|nr:YigZ family protein [Bacillus thuringiensis]TKA00077.1 YigZ family protein [Bacillus thuringiensis]
MLPQYYTVRERGEHEIIIKKSRFICHVNRATTEEEAQTFIQDIKKKHCNATHNCSAYLIGENDQYQKANDDGVPSGTAGVPILEVLKRRNLKDTVVVVTRYFGGIKLGAGGLVRAYGTSTSEGIKEVGVVKRNLMQMIQTTVDYTWLGKLENELRSSNYILNTINYLDKVEFETFVMENQTQSFMSWIIELTNGQCNFQKGNLTYLEKTL